MKRKSNIRWKPAGTAVRNGKRVKVRDRIVIELGVSFERWEYEQAMRNWPIETPQCVRMVLQLSNQDWFR